MKNNKLSQLMTYILRHHPTAVGLQLDDNGWVNLELLLIACNTAGHRMTREQVVEMVRTNDKQRFAISEDGSRIRANQGHSVKVRLEFEEKVPHEVLYHGTALRFAEKIWSEGLKKMARHHVHLSVDMVAADTVGRRRGKPVVFKVMAKAMYTDGYKFFLSTNGVWLTDHVPPQYLFLTVHDEG